jgi:hypothetical protein
MSQSRQLTRVAEEARPDPDKVKLRDVSSGLRDMMQVAAAAGALGQQLESRPRPIDPHEHGSEQEAARAALMDALRSSDPAQRMQAARVLIPLLAEEDDDPVAALIELVRSSLNQHATPDVQRLVAADIAHPEVTAGGGDQN